MVEIARFPKKWRIPGYFRGNRRYKAFTLKTWKELRRGMAQRRKEKCVVLHRRRWFLLIDIPEQAWAKDWCG